MEHSYIARPIVLPPLQGGGSRVEEMQAYARAAVTADRAARGRHPPGVLAIARRHPKLFSKLIEKAKP